MKSSNLVIAIAITSFTIGFSSCKKSTDNTSTNKEEIETTIELSTDQAISDNLTEDANDIFLESATTQGLSGAKPLEPFEPLGILGCGTVNVTPAIGWPKTIVIDFGTGCTSPNTITRTGKINIVLSDSLRKKGSTAVLNFDGYTVNGYKKEGTVTWTNTSTAAVKGWERKVENGKITAPNGKYWLHTGIRYVVQTAGWDTPLNLPDDAFSITGNSTVTNSNNVSATATILTALEKKTICENISKGTVQLDGPKHTAVIDYGNGDCDKLATISIDGGTAISFSLR